jgi:hypothetical protein
MRRIFRPQKKGSDWRKLCNEELHNLYSSPSITDLIKSRGWVVCSACMKREMPIKFWFGIINGRD